MADEPTTLDLRGLNCPLPVLKAKKAMREMRKDELVILQTTDPLAVIDIPAFCSEAGHEFVNMEETDGHHRFTLRCGAKAQSAS